MYLFGGTGLLTKAVTNMFFLELTWQWSVCNMLLLGVSDSRRFDTLPLG